MRIAVTGHMDLSGSSVSVVRDAVLRELDELVDRSGWTGVSCLAQGADTIFAQAVLDRGGVLEAVIPSVNYRERKVKDDHAPVFDDLIARATTVRTMPFDDAGKEAYEAANEVLVAGSDVLIAVWDGQESRRSGTGTVVEQARKVGRRVVVVWPGGATRTGG